MEPVTEKTVLIVVSSRSEVIKMAPIYLSCKRAHVPVVMCVINHSPLIKQIFDLFKITPDIVVQSDKDTEPFLKEFQRIIEQMQPIIQRYQPFLVVVHGDSVTSMAVAMASFYATVAVAHVEAGLRTDDLFSPFPHEMQRRVITAISTFHFAPTMAAVGNLLTQGVRREHVFCTGNTGVDAVMIIKEKIMHKEIMINSAIHQAIVSWRHKELSIGLITLGDIEHTSQDRNLLFSLLQQIQNCAWIIVVKDNTNGNEPLGLLYSRNNSLVVCCSSLDYKDMVYVLDNADVVLTDSGVIQEEAVSLGKHVLILRHKTEYMEGVLADQAQVVGFSPLLIMSGIEQALSKNKSHKAQSVYGDGHAAEKIVAFVQVRYAALAHNSFSSEGNYYQQTQVE